MFTSTESCLISNFKKLVLSLYLWPVITWAPKARLSEKHLGHKKVKKKKKKNRGTQSHRHCRDHEEKWKAKQKRDRDTRKMHQIVKFVNKLSYVSEKLQRNLCFCFGPVYIFRPKSGISVSTAETLPVLLVFKPIRNEDVFVPFQAPVRKISVVLAGMVRN